MDRVDALEKLYIYRFEAGKNILYHGGLSSWYTEIDSYITLGVLLLSAVAFGFAFIGALKGEFPFKKFAAGWWAVCIASIPTILAFVLVFWNPSRLALEHGEAFTHWQDVRERDAHLQNAVVGLKNNQPLPECLIAELDALDSSVVRVETTEPRERYNDFLTQCYRDEIQQIFNTPDYEAVEQMKKTDPKTWARLKYLFNPDEETLNRLRGDRGKTASQSRAKSTPSAH